MSRRTENRGFCCEHCQQLVQPVTNGSYRNHCPFCLRSKHVDIVPGDRRNPCGGLMDPIGLRVGRKGYQLVFRCRRCRACTVNRVAEQTEQPDDFDLLLKLMQSGRAL
ncbi:MAG: RNHCP domain-containing protein [Chloroflexi bacterium]|nr:MAG: RNHCP domain-containing protein [Chloroflexota bacterium]